MTLTKDDFCFLAGMESLKEDFALAHDLAESMRAGKPKVWQRDRKHNGYGRTDKVREESMKKAVLNRLYPSQGKKRER